MATEIDDGELIESIRKFPSVYDKNHRDYRNRQCKTSAWIGIAQMIGVEEELCEQRWIVLRNRYATELRNGKKNPNRGTSWRYFDAMSFLEEYISPRRTRSSLTVSPVKRTFTREELKSEPKVNTSCTTGGIPPEALVTVELGSTSPPNNTVTTTRLRPIAPRPAVSTVARLVTIPSDGSVSNVIQTSPNCFSRHSEYKERQENEDEDILFGKSIGHTLKTIKNKKIKLQVKSEILSILAKHAD